MGVLFSENMTGLSIFHSIDEHPEQSSFSMHVHAQNEIYVFASGSATYLVEGNEYPLSIGSMLMIREGESHAVNIKSNEPYERFVINLSPTFTAAIDPERRLLSPFYDRPLGVGNLYSAAELKGTSAIAALKAMCVSQPDPEEQRLAILSQLLPLLYDVRGIFNARQNAEERGKTDILASQIIAHLNENLLSPITVTDVAKRFYLSVSQLERIFKQATHSSIWHYISAKRLAAARLRIENGMPSTRASEECGFGDYSAFYRAYIKEYGESPSAHRKSSNE